MTSTDNTSVPQADAPAATPAAATEATPKEVIDQLHERLGKKRGSPNERTAERRPWVTSLVLVLEDPDGKPRTVEVTTHDISVGGFSFVYRQFLHAGTKIRAHFSILPGRPFLDGIVRNCMYVGGMHHRVGVQFNDRCEEKANRYATA